MDKIDLDLLELLAEDARRTPEQVGVLLGLSAAEAKARMDGLEAAGVIRGYTVLIDREQMPEETISALIEVKVQPERNRGFDAIAEQLYLFDGPDSWRSGFRSWTTSRAAPPTSSSSATRPTASSSRRSRGISAWW